MNLFTIKNINFIQLSRYTLYGSLFIIVFGIISFFTIGLKTSIDFTGGTIINLKIVDEKFNISDLRSALIEELDDNVKVVKTKSNQNHELLITMKFLKDENILHNLLSRLYNSQYEILQIESIGAKIGDELKTNARNAIIISLILIGLYITIRFDSFYAIGSIIALFHDILITLSFIIFFQYELSISIIAALLTIVGYSLNDTIVIYDRVRENVKLLPKGDKIKIVNKSLNKTLNRTLITSITTLIVVIVLFLIGGKVLQPFSFALIVGVVVGTYSSLFIATPAMLILENRYKLEDIEEEI